MAFFKLKKKKEESFDIPMPSPEMQPQQSSPVEQVLMMKQQGYTNNQIVQMLQGQGYNTQQVYDAINKANLSTDFQSTEQPEMGMSDYGQSYEQQYQQQLVKQLLVLLKDGVPELQISSKHFSVQKLVLPK